MKINSLSIFEPLNLPRSWQSQTPVENVFFFFEMTIGYLTGFSVSHQKRAARIKWSVWEKSESSRAVNHWLF